MAIESIPATASSEVSLRVRPGTPDRVSIDVPREYTTTDLIIRLCDDDEFGPQAWDPHFPVMHYSAYLTSSDEPIADLDIDYNYETSTMSVDMVGIYDDKHIGKGYGIQMYMTVPTMALPDGRLPHEAGFTFITEAHSQEAERVWRALARRGLATSVGSNEWNGNAYIWNSYDKERREI